MSLLEETLKYTKTTGGILPVRPGEKKEEKGKKSPIVVWGLGLTSVALAGCGPEVSTPTPTPESINYSVFFSQLQNSPELQANPDVKKLTASQKKFLKNFPQAQFGPEIVLGINNPDCVLRSFVNEKGEPTGMGVVTYEKDSQPTTRIVAELPPFVVEDPNSPFNGQVAAGLVVLNEQATENIVNSKEPIAIDPAKDGESTLLLMVLEKGVSWEQFVQQLNQAPDEKTRAQILSSKISLMAITDPNDGHLYPLPTEFKPRLSDLMFVSYQSSHPNPPPTETPTPTTESTPTPTISPEVVNMINFFETEKAPYELDSNQQIIIDLYDTQQKEKIIIKSAEIITTQDGLNPNILTAKDNNNNLYAFNPEHGWFKIPDIYNPFEQFPPTYTLEAHKEINEKAQKKDKEYFQRFTEAFDPKKYPEIDENFIKDGRFNITAALTYQNLPAEKKILEQAPKGQWWISWEWVPKFLQVSIMPPGAAISIMSYSEEIAKDEKLAENSIYGTRQQPNPPFVFNSFWKVKMKDGNVVYVAGATLRNPDPNNSNRLINLAYGFDSNFYEESAAKINKLNLSFLAGSFLSVIDGSYSISFHLVPPEKLPDGRKPPTDFATTYTYMFTYIPSPYLSLVHGQTPGRLIELFPQEDRATIIKVLSECALSETRKDCVEPLKNGVPPELAREILWSRIAYR